MTSQTRARRALFRWLVHLGLIGALIASLAFEPLVLAIHIAAGLAFVVLAGLHLAQRRRISARLVAGLARVRILASPSGRLALADLLLAVITAGMLVSGFWDWSAGHPTKIRWHAITGVALAILLVAHTIRRRSRLRRSGGALAGVNEHGLLGAGPEVAGPGLERREHRRPGSLTPQAILIGVQAQAIAIPRAQGRRVSGPHEVPADAKHTFHAAILPGRRSGRRAPHRRLLHPGRHQAQHRSMT